MSNRERSGYLRGCYHRLIKQWKDKMGLSLPAAKEWAQIQLRESIAQGLV